MGGSWRTISVALRADTSGYLGPLGTASAATRKLGAETDAAAKKTSSSWTSLSKVVKVGAAGLVLAVGAFIGASIKAAAEFESKMSAIGAVTGATAGQLDQLRGKALQLGADTTFSAGEAAGAMEALAKAGVPVEGILNGAADATVALAAAGGVDLPVAAEIAANAMNQFGLSAQELPHIADLIAGAANASAIDVTDFGQSMSQAGAVAKLTGLSFDDAALAITAMGNAGIKGSDAGTSLKTFLTRLVPVGEKATTAMMDLGIVTEDGKNQFFDAAGSVKSMAEISDVLAESLKGQSKEQQLATLQTLFGADAIRAAAVIADEGSAGFEKLNDQLNSVSAADVAAARMDNLGGSVEQLKGSVETLMIKVGSNLTPFLRVAADAATGFVNALGDGSGVVAPLADAIGLLEPAWQGLTDTVGNFLNILGDVADVVGPVALGFAKLAAGATIIGLNALATALGAISGFLADNDALVKTLTVSLLALGAVAAWGPLVSGAETFALKMLYVQDTIVGTKIAGALSAIGTQLGVVATGAGQMAAGVEGGFSTLTSGLGGIAGAIGPVGFAVGALAIVGYAGFSRMEDGAKKARKEIERLSKGLDTTSLPDLEKLQRQFQNLADMNYDSIDQVFGVFGDTKAEEYQKSADKLGASIEDLKGKYTAAQDALSKELGINLNIDQIKNFAEAAKIDVNKLGTKEFAAAVLDVKGKASSATPAVQTLTEAVTTIGSEASSAEDKVSAFKDMLDALIGTPKSLFDATTSYSQAVRDLGTAVAENGFTLDGYTEKGSAVRSALSGLVDDAKASSEAILDNGGSAEEAAAKLRDAEKVIRDLGGTAGASKPEIDALLAELGLVPGTYEAILGADSGNVAEVVDAANHNVSEFTSLDATQYLKIDTAQAQYALDYIDYGLDAYITKNPTAQSFLNIADPVTRAAELRVLATQWIQSNPTAKGLYDISNPAEKSAILDAIAAKWTNKNPTTTARAETGSAEAALNQAARDRYAKVYEQYIADPRSAGDRAAKTFGRRWGGVDYSFAGGGMTPAHIAAGQRIKYAEPQTGGELYMPRLGDRARNLSILGVGAGWMGMDLVPRKKLAMAAGGLLGYTPVPSGGGYSGGGGSISIDASMTFSFAANGDTAVMDMVRREVIPAIERQPAAVHKVLRRYEGALR